MTQRRIRFTSVAVSGDIMVAVDDAGDIWKKPANKAGDWKREDRPQLDYDPSILPGAASIGDVDSAPYALPPSLSKKK